MLGVLGVIVAILLALRTRQTLQALSYFATYVAAKAGDAFAQRAADEVARILGPVLNSVFH